MADGETDLQWRRRVKNSFPNVKFAADYVRLEIHSSFGEHSQLYKKIKKLVFCAHPESIEKRKEWTFVKSPEVDESQLSSMERALHPIIISDNVVLTGVFQQLLEEPIDRKLLEPQYSLSYDRVREGDSSTIFLRVDPQDGWTSGPSKKMALKISDVVNLFNNRAPLISAMGIHQRPLSPGPFTADQCHLMVFSNAKPDAISSYDGYFWGAGTSDLYYLDIQNSYNIRVVRTPEEANAVMRRRRCVTKASNRLKKTVYFLESNKTSVSLPALVCYSFMTKCDSPVPPPFQVHANSKSQERKFVRINEEQKGEMRRMHDNGKTITQINASFPQFSTSQIRNVVETVSKMKSKCFYQFGSEEALLALGGEDVEVDVWPFTEPTENGPKAGVCASYILKNPLRAFLNSCPSVSDIRSWRREVVAKASDIHGLLTQLANEADLSGFNEDWGGSVFYDTTFDLSEEIWISFLVGDFPEFTNRRSGKRHFQVIAFMLHTSKAAMCHEHFFSFFSKTCLKFDKQKRCSAFCSDAEAAFNTHKEQPFFDMSHHLRCSFHFVCRLTTNRNRNTALKTILFGYTNVNGEYERGAMLVASQKLMLANLRDLLNNNVITSGEYERITKTSRLYECYSLIGPLMVKRSLSFLTSNTAENFNRILKEEIGSYSRPAVKLAEDVLRYSKDQYTLMQHAADFENGGTLCLREGSEYDKYMGESERKRHFHKLGIVPPKATANFRFPLPDALFFGMSNKRREAVIDAVKVFVVRVYVDGSGASIEENDQHVASIRISEKVPKCRVDRGKCERSVCLHIYAFLQHLDNDEKREGFIAALVGKLTPRDSFVPPTTTTGSKFIRKLGGEPGSSNRSRAIRRYAPSDDKGEIEFSEEPEHVQEDYLNLSLNVVDDNRPVLVEKVEKEKPANKRKPKVNSRYNDATYITEKNIAVGRKRRVPNS